MIETIGRFDETDVQQVRLSAVSGASAVVMTWGAVVRDLLVPLPNGALQRVVLGLERFEDYPDKSPYFGAIAGRYANRIGGGRFTLDGASHQLPLNEKGRQHLHGGPAGFGRRNWSVVSTGGRFVTLALDSADGDQGYPGRVKALCTYTLAEPATLRVELSATTDAPTVVNLAHHTYWNLDGSDTISGHHLQIEADFFTPVDAELIPTGEILSVAGGAFDFRSARPVHRDPAHPFPYDNNFVLRKRRGPFTRIATLSSPRNGLAMQLWSTENGLQVYDGARVNVDAPGHDGRRYGAFAGMPMEPQTFPDTPNEPHLGDATLRPGETYRQVTEYRFAAAG